MIIIKAVAVAYIIVVWYKLVCAVTRTLANVK